jgi:filamentous hemagglutinin family protein
MTFRHLIPALVLLTTSLGLDAEISYTTDPNTLLTGDVIIPAENGQVSGANLLHSFDRFSIPVGSSATFTGPDSIANLIARVTGILPSEIDGLLRSEIVDADLFLLNPNGVMFSSSAIIDINGSLYVSTAQSLVFEDGSRISLSDTGQSTLTTAPPSAFGFDASPAPIQLKDAILGVDLGEAVTLIGGHVDLQDSVVYASEGQLDLLAIKGTADVAIDPASRTPLESSALGDIAIVDQFAFGENADLNVRLEQRFGTSSIFTLDTRGNQGGDISITGDAVHIDRSILTATSSGDSKAGRVFLSANDLTLWNGARIAANARGTGSGGEIDIQAGQMSMDGSQVYTNGYLGNAGTVTITADQIDLTASYIFAQARDSGFDAGLIQLSGGVLNLESASWLSTETVYTFGNAGDIFVDFDEINITQGSVLATRSFGTGNSGDIELSGGSLRVDEGFILSGTNSGFSGNSGDISLDLDSILLTNDAVLFSGAYGSGSSGNISVRADSLAMDYSRLETISYDLGTSGDISIVADEIDLTSSRLDLSSFSLDQAGSASIAAGSINLMGSWILADSNWEGAAGSIQIDAADISFSTWMILSSNRPARGHRRSVRAGLSEAITFPAEKSPSQDPALIRMSASPPTATDSGKVESFG